jgi:hypothetical protein
MDACKLNPWIFYRFMQFEDRASEERIIDKDLAQRIKERGLDDKDHTWPYPRPTDSLQVYQISSRSNDLYNTIHALCVQVTGNLDG